MRVNGSGQFLNFRFIKNSPWLESVWNNLSNRNIPDLFPLLPLLSLSATLFRSNQINERKDASSFYTTLIETPFILHSILYDKFLPNNCPYSSHKGNFLIQAAAYWAYRVSEEIYLESFSSFSQLRYYDRSLLSAM